MELNNNFYLVEKRAFETMKEHIYKADENIKLINNKIEKLMVDKTDAENDKVRERINLEIFIHKRALEGEYARLRKYLKKADKFLNGDDLEDY